MKILTIVGARPQFIKAAVVSRVLREIPNVQETLLHTGQHYDANMSRVFFDELDIPHPNYNLGIGGGTHGENTGRMIEAIEKVLLKEKPDWVIVYGDTDSTLAGALAAVKLHIPIAHVEAGLRSFNRRMPEEINRVLTDHTADMLFAPTETAVNNLRNEGISKDKIFLVGDVMYDAALYYADRAKKPELPPYCPSLNQPFVLATLHRSENTNDPARLQEVFSALVEISGEIPVVMPLHPRTKLKLKSLGMVSFLTEYKRRLCFIEPISYLEMIWLLKRCHMVMTDSGGLQKEAYFFQKPCITLREETEWVELVNTGVNIVVKINKEIIVNLFHSMFHKKLVFPKGIYGTGNACGKIIHKLLEQQRSHSGRDLL